MRSSGSLATADDALTTISTGLELLYGWHSLALGTPSILRVGETSNARGSHGLHPRIWVRKEVLAGRSNVHIRPLALPPSPAPLASLFPRGFTQAELLASLAWSLAPRKSSFLPLNYQISVGLELSGYVHHRPRVSLPGGGQELLPGLQHPPVTSSACPWSTSQCQMPPIPPHPRGHWGWQICHCRELGSALGSHLLARESLRTASPQGQPAMAA